MFGKGKPENKATETVESAGGKQEQSANQPAFRGKKKSKKKKRIIIAVVVILAIAVAASFMLRGKEVLMPTPTGTVSTMDVQQIISIKGTVEGNDQAEITSAENKEIATISVKEGDRVTKGQVLATLKEKDDTSNDEVYQRQQAQNNLESAKFDYDTSKLLFEQGAISQQELLKSETSYKNAQSVLAGINDKKKDEDNNITSPISGIVTRVNAKVGFTASQMEKGAALFVVEDLSNLKMEIKVSEYDISSIKVGQTVSIAAEVLGEEKVSGVISHIAPTGEMKNGDGKEMVIPVKIDILPNDKNLIAGVTAKAEILVAEAKNAIAVPSDCLLTDPATGEFYLFTVDKDNKLVKQVVTLGLESDFFVEITSGNLKAGDTIVATPTADMTDGQVIATENPGDAAADGAVSQ